MSVDEAILFYSKRGNQAWQRVLNAVDAGANLDTEDGDLLHSQFCADCCVFLMTMQLKANLNSPNIGSRLWTNWHYYQRHLIELKHRTWN